MFTIYEAYTVMCHITMFPSTMDHIYNGGPIRLYCCIFTVSFLCLDMFRYTNSYHCVTIATVLSAVTCCPGL
uniref:PRO2532 n=1 Tax=Homo sapiens TaxID=9606 RepID=Q9H399_HUMAN|nr:PRO2532 [Homo sapiens]